MFRGVVRGLFQTVEVMETSADVVALHVQP
jgi:hypothetical protein